VIKRLLILLLAIGVGAAGIGWWARTRLTTPYKAFSPPEIFVELPAGSSVSSIANRLVAAGVLPDTVTFRLAARYTGADRRLQAGEYRFAGPSTPLQVLNRLATGDVYTHSVTFREGLTMFEMAEVFERSGLGSAADFLAAARKRTLIEARDPHARSLEGYLFPDTYALPRSSDADDLVAAMLARFDKVFDQALRAEAETRGMTTREVLTLASIVEKETGLAEERSKVSAVYHNRLRIGMPLQCDPTVIYALMLSGRWNGNLRRTDLQLKSPYNTYVVRGLPPGPIASPGRASIEAALRPADVPYLYFVSRNDGSHVFASTLAEHNRNVTQWQIKYFRKQ
jgi:UPF0755 protein